MFIMLQQRALSEDSTRTWDHLEIFSNKPFNLVKCYFHNTFYLGAINMHRHTFHELNIVTKGKGIHCMDNKTDIAEEGSVFLIPPNVEHGYMFDNDLVVFHMLLHSNFILKYSEELNSISDSLLNNMNVKLGSEDLAKLMNVLIELDQFQSTQDNVSDIMKNSLALYLISKLSTFIPKNEKEHKKTYPEEMIKCVDYINSRFTEKISTKELCKMLNVSNSTLRRYFIEEYGMTLSDYLQDLRIRYSIDLLKSTCKPIHEIAVECGFYDSSHFTKVFKDKTGYTPLSYRNI